MLDIILKLNLKKASTDITLKILENEVHDQYNKEPRLKSIKELEEILEENDLKRTKEKALL